MQRNIILAAIFLLSVTHGVQAQKWLDEVGPAHCPQHGEMSVDKAGGKDEGDE